MFPDDSSLGENWGCSLGFENSPSTPTPPQSPESKTYGSLDCETLFSNVDMVDPNAVLDESHLILDSPGFSFHPPSLNFSEDSLKRECWIPIADCLTGSSCKNEIFNDSFRENSTDSSTKTEIRNDCMWTSGSEDIKPDRSPTSPKTNDSVSKKFCTSRSRLDSIPSKYSEITDPLSNIIAITNSHDTASQKIMLNTPADTSDTDADTETDLEDTCSIADNIHLEHNYHFNNRISSAFQKSFNEQSAKRQQINYADYSDEETTIDEDSENSESGSDLSRNCTQIANHLTFKSSKENVIINTSFNITDLPKFRKLENRTYIPRKVGRPSKNLKRVENSFPNIKRSSYRAVQMNPEKREAHNSMERMRRVNLKSDFNSIRELVPSLADRPRAPKVLILKSAVEFVYELRNEIQNLNLEMLRLSHHNSLLKQKFEELKKEKGIADMELG